MPPTGRALARIARLMHSQVVAEACGDCSPAIHDANVFDMDAKMADVVSEGEAVEKLRAGWP